MTTTTKERNILADILKSWAQEHDTNYRIASPKPGDDGVAATGSFFTWLIKETDANIGMVDLLDRLELYATNLKNKRYPDGHFCRRCQTWVQFAEPNQDDGTFVCYTCRKRPGT